MNTFLAIMKQFSKELIKHKMNTPLEKQKLI